VKPAIAVHEELVRRFGSAQEPGLRELVAKARTNRGVWVGVLGRSVEAIAAYDEDREKFGVARIGATREQVAKALPTRESDWESWGVMTEGL